jgi:hypothetical protein
LNARTPQGSPYGATALRDRAETLAGPLPALLAEAEQLAATVMLGEHGRRRAGTGDEFWQYRPAHASDPARLIDWRRSGRSDAHFVREREWQAAQSVSFWVDNARAMAFSGDPARPEKGARACWHWRWRCCWSAGANGWALRAGGLRRGPGARNCFGWRTS